MDYKGKKVLVAGGAGLVGTNLAIRLTDLGADVRATIHYRRPVPTHRGVEYVEYDLTQYNDCLKAVRGIDYVFMCAAVIAGAGVITKDPLFNVTPNILLNTQMLAAAYAEGIKKYLTFGSSTAYPHSDYPLREARMMSGNPPDQYFFIGWVMRFKEKLCEMYSNRIKNPMPVVVLRPTNIYGPYDNFDLDRSHVTPALIRKVVERHNPLEVWGTGDDIRDLVYVDDIVDAVLLAMDKVNRYDPINIASGRPCSIKEILSTALAVEGYLPKVIYNSNKPSTISKRIVDTSKARLMLSWDAKTSLYDGILKTIEWYKSVGRRIWK